MLNEDCQECNIMTYNNDRKIFKAVGFEFLKWTSNSHALIDHMLTEQN